MSNNNKDFYEDKPDRYDHARQVWHVTFDNFRDCKLPITKCEMGYPGHFTCWTAHPIEEQTNGAGERFFKVKVRIFHAHFVYGKDQGRHVDHQLKEFRWLHEDAFNFNPKLKHKYIPRWLGESSE